MKEQIGVKTVSGQEVGGPSSRSLPPQKQVPSHELTL